MARAIFREAALERLASPEQLDQLMRVPTPAGWLALVALAGLLLVAVGWSLSGTLPIEVSGRALIMREGGVRTVASLADGQIERVLVQAGDVVQAGQPLLLLSDGQTLVAPFTARILELRVTEGSAVARGTPAVTLERAAQDVGTIAVMFLPPDEARQVRPGMPVRLAPLGEAGAAVAGHVTGVTGFPLTTDGMRALVGSHELGAWLAGADARYAVHLALVPPTPRAGLESGALPPSGTLAQATIRVEERHPIEFVLP